MSLPDHIQRAIRSGPVPEIRDWRNLPAGQLTRAEKNMRFIERYCIVPEGALVGQKIRLADFQQAFYYAVYDNPDKTTDAYLSIARKNSKTATIACMVICHLVGPEAQQNAEIVSGARSREQAGQVYRYAEKMVNLSDRLREIVRCVPSKKKLIGLLMGTEYTASAAEAQTAHGGSPVLAILDEVGQVRGEVDDYIDAIITSQGAHNSPLLVAISTQAPTDADLLSIWLDDADRSEDSRIVSHVYEAQADCDVSEESQWQAANPALGLFRSEADMRKMAEKAARMPSFENTFRNLYLNQRVNTVEPFVSHSIWQACNEEPMPLDPDVKCYAGLDLSARTDLTALVVKQYLQEKWQTHAYFWTPEEGLFERVKKDRAPYDAWVKNGWLYTTPGKTVDYGFVAQQMGEILGDMDVVVGYDRWRIDLFRRELEKAGLSFELVPVGQGYKDSSPALETLEAQLLNAQIAHGGHPVLTMCAANAVATRDPTNARKLDKAKATGRIDGMSALMNATFVADAQEEEKPRGISVYEEGVV